MQRSYIIITLAASLLLGACGGKKEAAPALKDTEIIPVKLMPVIAGDAAGSISVSGRFTTDDETLLSFKTGGIVQKIFVREGDAIRSGQLLATLHLTEINAQVAQAQAAYEKAVRDQQRTANLYADSVASLEQLQNSKTALELASQQLNAARFNRNYSEIRATQNGYVLRKMVAEGQVVAPGTPVLQTNGASGGNWILRAGLSDKDWAAIKEQEKAVVTTEAAAGSQFQGYVLRRSEGVDPTNGSFTVDIKLEGKLPQNIAAGMFGRAVIHQAAAEKAKASQDLWAIPYDALLDGDGSTGFVFVTHDNKTAHKVKVTIAGMDKDQVWISDGLQAGGSLIISGSPYLNDNSPIKVIQ